MAENQILPFASQDTGTNLLPQSEYAADVQRVTGNQPGIARSKLVNKALRQATSMAAGLAQFIADGQADDVTDAKTPAEIAAMLASAAAAQMPDASASAAGKIRVATSAEAYALAATDAALTPANFAYALRGAVNTGTNQCVKIGDVYLQCGSASIAANSSTRITFPIAFPNACVSLVASLNAWDQNIGSGEIQTYIDYAASSVITSTHARGVSAYWVALGV